MKSKKYRLFLLFMLENSKMLPLPANVDCYGQSTFSQRYTVNITVNVAKMLAGAAFLSFQA